MMNILPIDEVIKHKKIAKANTIILFIFNFDYYSCICLRNARLVVAKDLRISRL